MEDKEWFSICMIIIVVSFLGFVVENIWLAFTKGFMDNRNMLFPFLLGYGLAVVIIYLLLGTPEHMHIFNFQVTIENEQARNVLYAMLVCLCISVGEIALGTLVEKICGIVWWNYSWLPMHITKYTSLLTSAGFAILITLFMKYLFAPICIFSSKLQVDIWGTFVNILMGLMFADFMHSAIYMRKNQSLMKVWHIQCRRIDEKE